MTQQDAADITKRIPKSLGTETKLIGNYTLMDLVIAVAPGALVVLVTRSLVPDITIAGTALQAIAIPLAALTVAVGVLFVSLTPAYTDSLTWSTSFLSYYRSAPDAGHTEAAEYTRLERVYPEWDAIERTDGALVGAIQIDPAAMALATDAQWKHTATEFTDFLNTTVEFPVQLYSTTQPFPVDEYLARYEARLDDPEVEANPTLQRLIERYLDWYRADLQSREMTIRDHYLIVPIRPESVRHTDTSIAQQLSQVPYLGPFVHAVTASPIAEERAAMAAELDDRLQRAERGIRELTGCSATRVPAADLTDLVADYWAASEPGQVRETATTLRTTPLVGGPDR